MAIFHFPQFEHEPFWQYLSRLNDSRDQYVLSMYKKWEICAVVLEGITHETRATLESCPSGSSDVRHFGSLTKRSNTGDVRKMIHEGKVFKLGRFLLANNPPDIILDDEKLADARSNYLVALRNSFLNIYFGASFHVEPYRPHRLSRQFGFCQRTPMVLLSDPHLCEVSYEDALY